MDEELKKLLIGVIFIILAINTTVVFDIASRTSPQNPAASSAVAVSPVITTPAPAPSAAPTAAVSPVPTAKPLANPAPANSSKSTSPPVQTPLSQYVIVETVAPLVQSPDNTYIEQTVEDPYKNFITIYSINNQNLTRNLPRVYFNLVNPPLIIDYNISPTMITDIKWIANKTASRGYREYNENVTRPFEQSWFTVNVSDKNTGEIIAEDGYGKTYLQQSPKQITIRKSGNFQFDFDGNYGKVTLTMKVNKSGNIP